MEIRGLLRRCLDGRQQMQALETALGDARLAAQSLETDLREVERQTGMLVAPAPARSGLNLSKRTHVLRMHRAGQDSAGIAAALALPRSEVELLIKVHRIVVDQI
jgi:DNA-binding NarL/FixJ family response regulator